MLDIKEMLKINPEDLRQEQYEALKAFAISRLQEFIGYLEEDDLKSLEKNTDHSPAGDGWGRDSNYLVFDFTGGENNNHCVGELIEKLKKLKGVSDED